MCQLQIINKQEKGGSGDLFEWLFLVEFIEIICFCVIATRHGDLARFHVSLMLFHINYCTNRPHWGEIVKNTLLTFNPSSPKYSYQFNKLYSGSFYNIMYLPLGGNMTIRAMQSKMKNIPSKVNLERQHAINQAGIQPENRS